jgi:hypothetical protein
MRAPVYDGAEPSAVGTSGSGQAVAGNVTGALVTGRFFWLVDGKGRELAIGRSARTGPRPGRARTRLAEQESQAGGQERRMGGRWSGAC